MGLDAPNLSGHEAKYWTNNNRYHYVASHILWHFIRYVMFRCFIENFGHAQDEKVLTIYRSEDAFLGKLVWIKWSILKCFTWHYLVPAPAPVPVPIPPCEWLVPKVIRLSSDCVWFIFFSAFRFSFQNGIKIVYFVVSLKWWQQMSKTIQSWKLTGTRCRKEILKFENWRAI